MRTMKSLRQGPTKRAVFYPSFFPAQAVADRIASYFVPVVVLLALAVLGLWLALAYEVSTGAFLSKG